MSIRNQIMPFVAQALTSEKTQSIQRRASELKRRVKNTPHTIIFYHRISDPYSYLLLQTFPNILNQFAIDLQIKLVTDLPADMTPEPELLEKYARTDAQQLAQFHQLKFPSSTQQPSKENCLLATQILLQQQNSTNLLQIALEVTESTWDFGSTTLSSCANRYGTTNLETTLQITTAHTAELVRNGHYLSAMLYYGGEWYWGVDRLFHLADRLSQLDLNKAPIDWNSFNKQYQTHYDGYHTLQRPPQNMQILDFYFSFRSPYSYIALERTFQLCDHYKISLNIKPVLPMVMRGLTVPKAKRLYILRDTKREAKKHGIAFGKICDPIGNGVERCLAIYAYAKKENKEQEYLLSVCKGIWSEGVDVASDDLSKLVERAGLSWPTAQNYLQEEQSPIDNWQRWTETNRKDLFDQGIWGVPSYQYGDTVVWGQDRLWAIEQAIVGTG